MDININYDICLGIKCLECFDICPMEVFEVKDSIVFVKNLDKCCRCEVCIQVCPKDAIKIIY